MEAAIYKLLIVRLLLLSDCIKLALLHTKKVKDMLNNERDVTPINTPVTASCKLDKLNTEVLDLKDKIAKEKIKVKKLKGDIASKAMEVEALNRDLDSALTNKVHDNGLGKAVDSAMVLLNSAITVANLTNCDSVPVIQVKMIGQLLTQTGQISNESNLLLTQD